VPPSRDLEREWCANYQFFVKAKDSGAGDAVREMYQKEHCTSEELPHSLNTFRVLEGPKGE